MVTSKTQMIEAKGVDPIELPNYLRVLFSSNEDWVVPAGLDERRFAVLDVAATVAQNHDYFAEMERELDDGGRAALLADLLAFDLDSVNLRVIPKTAALLEQKLRSLDPITRWWFERLSDGTTSRRAAKWYTPIPIDTLYNDYVHNAEQIGDRRRAEKIAFGIKLAKLIPGLEVTKKRLGRRTARRRRAHGQRQEAHQRLQAAAARGMPRGVREAGAAADPMGEERSRRSRAGRRATAATGAANGRRGMRARAKRTGFDGGEKWMTISLSQTCGRTRYFQRRCDPKKRVLA
jgi:hypothetical protein